jgi:hypothetical protein
MVVGDAGKKVPVGGKEIAMRQAGGKLARALYPFDLIDGH